MELVSTVSTAIELVKKARDLTSTLRHAELKNIIGDLSLQLADVKIGMADLVEENHRLKKELESLRNADGDPCPKCRLKTFRVESSRPDSAFGVVGGIRRELLCSSCGYSEEQLHRMPR